jgi:PHD/YefM family antitoxin component YafN of YafNO toxin-antitoxin module
MRNYIVDETGKKKAVIIDLEEFNNLIDYMEEIEDALDLKRAMEEAGEFAELGEFIGRMKREGKV